MANAAPKITEADFKSDDGEVQVLKVSLFNLIVCAPAEMTTEELEMRVNAMWPAGTTHGWRRSEEHDSEPNKAPVACGDNPNRTHFIMWC